MSSSHVVTGRVQITEIDGIPAEYAPAARRYLGDQAAGAYLAQIGQPGTRMASIDLHPTWVACSTFNPGSRTSLAASHDRRHDPAPRVTVRPAVPSDAQDNRSGFDAAVRAGWAYLGDLAAEPMFTPLDWDQLLADHLPPNVLLVAVHETDGVVGYTAVHPSDGEMFVLFVHPPTPAERSAALSWLLLTRRCAQHRPLTGLRSGRCEWPAFARRTAR